MATTAYRYRPAARSPCAGRWRSRSRHTAVMASVDLEAVRENASILADTPVSAIVAPSGTGEFFALTPGESNEIVAATVEAAGGKPVIAAAGIGPRIGAELAAAAERAGARR